MLTPLYNWLIERGMDETSALPLMLLAGLILTVLLAWVTDYMAKRILIRGIKRLAHRTVSHWNDIVIKHRVLHRATHLAPALVIYHLAIPMMAGYEFLTAVVRQGALIYMIVVVALAVDSALNAGIEVVRTSRLPRDLPVRSIAQVLKLMLYTVASITVLSLVLGRSPLLLLSGLGAMSAVMMIIFKDVLLGFVAGIQLSANRMVSPGDWIEMPNQGADGDVVEVGLTTVRVQNWDKTITTIPTYALITESFKNWRGMSESEGRRIKRALYIDVGSIRFCDEAMLARYAKIQYIAEYLKDKREEIATWNAAHQVDPSGLANGRNLTNVGTFRAYIVAYLRRHPMVHQDMTFLVRQLDPTVHGLPIEIYVFSRDQDWSHYEAIQADIFDHLLAVVPEFDLRVFQSPSGHDVDRVLGSAVGDRAVRERQAVAP